MVAIGVTGHRILTEIDKITAGVDQALLHIEQQLPGQPLTVISALAEGGDRLVAERALGRLRARLVVPLPVPVDDYMNDFASAESKAEFRRLLERADQVVDLPQVSTRSAAYEAAGLYVLDHCDVLIAVWDGNTAQGAGGTAEIVAEARRRRLLIAWVHAGNRKPGTMEPTSLGAEQGKVTFENFQRSEAPWDADRRALVGPSDSSASVTEDEKLHSHIPFRIRVGVTCPHELAITDDIRGKLRQVLRETIPTLFDESSRARIDAARHTLVMYGVVTSHTEGAAGVVVDEILQQPLCPIGPWQRYSALAAEHRPIRQPLDTVRSRHIVEYCDVLLAIYDEGDRSDPHQVLATARTKKRPLILVSAHAPHDGRVEKGNGLSAELFAGIERFNALAMSAADQRQYGDNVYQEIFGTSDDSSFPGVEGDSGLAAQTGAPATRCEHDATREIPEEAKRTIREKLIPFYVRASQLAKFNQYSYNRAGLWVYSLTPVAVAAVVVATLFPIVAHWGFLIEFALLLLILGIVVLTDRRGARKKWIECRFLAERIRSAIFMAAAGAEPARIDVTPYTLGVDHSAQWMLLAFQEIWSRLPVQQPCWGQSCSGVITFIRKAWIRDQIEYHRHKAKTSERRSRVLERSGVVIFALALAAALGHLALSLRADGDHSLWLAHSLTSAALVLPAVGASLGGLRAHREYSRLEKRSKSMVHRLQDLDVRFAEVESSEAVQALLHETEELMLTETQDWLMLMGTMRLQTM